MQLGLCNTLLAIYGLENLETSAGEEIAKYPAVMPGVLDNQDPLHQAASLTSLARMGSDTRKVEPRPRDDSTVSIPPCSCTMRFDIARPSPVPPFSRVDELSTC